jgi:5-methylcytosine-specific restriction endonuclease McrA
MRRAGGRETALGGKHRKAWAGKRRFLAWLSVHQGGRCAYCDRFVTPPTRPSRPTDRTLDHVVPRVKGGTRDRANLVMSCLECNMKKSDRTDIVPLSKYWPRAYADFRTPFGEHE